MRIFDAAHAYAARGWQCFPCRPGRKEPLTPNGLLDATSEAGQLADWARRFPDANVAIRTGEASGIVVIDIDGDDGFETLRRLERGDAGALPTTYSVVTPRGGMHFYLRHPGAEMRNSAGKFGAGFDVRGDGGYVVAPPSVVGGRRYEVDEESAPAAIPKAWLEAFEMAESLGEHKPRAPVETWVGMVRDGLGKGERNQGLARLAGHLLVKDVDVRLVLELAQLVNLRSRPPLDRSEVERIVDSIAGREVKRRRGG